MTNELQNIADTLQKISNTTQAPFWGKGDFWISTILGVLGIILGALGVYYSIKAFMEAKQAKIAAKAAGRLVKYQTTTYELIDLLKPLASPSMQITFSTARDILADTTHKLFRIISTFEHEADVAEKIESLRSALDKAQKSLDGVRPTGAGREGDAPYAVYNAIEGDFARISNIIGELQGLFEKKTVNLGDQNATSAGD